MQKITDAKSGIYILELSSAKNFKVGIKKFSDIKLNSGFYYYIGSAQKNYNSRLVRHLKKSKTIHWHIDHLTTNAFLKINKIYLLENFSKDYECATVNSLEQLQNIVHPLDGFGNSDCKVCKSHLLYSKDEIAYSHFISLYQEIVLFKPSDKDTF